MARSLLLAVVLCLGAAVHAQAPPVRWVPASAGLVEPAPLSADLLFRTPSGALIAGTDAGLYRSENDGPWMRVTQDSLRDVHAVAWAASGTTRFVATPPFGVLASTDDGVTWHIDGLDDMRVVGLGALPDGAVVAVGSRGQTYRRDAAVWVVAGRPADTCYLNGDDLGMLDDGTLLLRCNQSFYRSADRGTTWALLDEPAPGRRVTQLPSGDAFLVRRDGSFARSLDAGLTWQTAGPALTPYVGALEAGSDGFLYYTSASTEGSTVVRSTNGASWAIVYQDGEAAALLPPGTSSPFLHLTLYAGGARRIDLATGTVVRIDAGVSQEPDASIASSAGPWTVFTTWRFEQPAIYRTQNRGVTWNRVPPPPSVGYIGTLLVLADGTILVGSDSRISRTSDGGQTWTTTSLPPLHPSNASYVDVILRTGSGTLLAGTSTSNLISERGDVFRSEDDGQTWVQTTSQSYFGPVAALLEGDGGTLFAGHKTAFVHGAGGALMRSDDDGRTWAVVRQGSVDAIAPISGGHFLVVTNDATTYRLARAFENGDAWDVLGFAPGRPDGMLRAADGAVYVHGSGGIQRTVDGGATWQSAGAGLPNRQVAALTQDADGYLYAGTPTGVFRSEQPAVAGAPGPEPVALALDRPRPNPARGRATLVFTLPDAGDVDLGLYDVLGRRVATLARGAFGAGRHEASWSASYLPAGTYLAVLRAPGGVSTQPVTVAR